MKFKTFLIAAFAVALSCGQVMAQATILPSGETCFSALTPTSGGPGNTGTGIIGLLGTITGGSGYTNGTYGGVSLTGGSGSNGTANITVSGGAVTGVTVLNPGLNYVVGDVLSAAAVNIGGTGSGFSVPLASISINYSLAGGTVAFYTPNTLVFKQTWQDAGQTILNQNPVALDANGCAVIYGAGFYRQILKDSLGNTIWDKLTTSTGANGQGIFWAGLSGGTGNAITITDPGFALQDGANIQFLASATNTGPTTISASGGGLIAIVNDTTAGPGALSGGEIVAGNTPMITYDATNVEFHLVNAAAGGGSGGSTAGLMPPQGYLNLAGLATGSPIQQGDVIGAATIFYSPYNGNTAPIWNGTLFRSLSFAELTTTLTASGSIANAVQDACIFSNNGIATLAIGPAWTSGGNRGTGAGTAQLTRLQGIWVNAFTIIAYNGLSTFTIPANQCTYVGSISIDSSAGQVSAYRTVGQSRKFGVWNTYNRQAIQLNVSDPSLSWTLGAPTSFRFSNGNAANNAQVLIGLPEEIVTSQFTQFVSVSYNNSSPIVQIAIGLNNIAPNNIIGTKQVTSGIAGAFSSANNLFSTTFISPAFGIQQLNMLEQVNTANPIVFSGTNNNMLMTVNYRG